MIPFNLLGPIGNAKSQDSRIRSHDTDIQRLMRMLQETMMGSGSAVGNDPDAVPSFEGYFPGGGGSGGLNGIHIGVTTADYTKSGSFDRRTDPGTVTADEDIDDPSDASTPRLYIAGPTAVDIVIRSAIQAIPSGTIIFWLEKSLSGGGTENLLTWADC